MEIKSAHKDVRARKPNGRESCAIRPTTNRVFNGGHASVLKSVARHIDHLRCAVNIRLHIFVTILNRERKTRFWVEIRKGLHKVTKQRFLRNIEVMIVVTNEHLYDRLCDGPCDAISLNIESAILCRGRSERVTAP